MKKFLKLGVFDSGVGGLSVLQEVMRLPFQQILYVADTANLPYGEKTQEQIIFFTDRIVNYLAQQQVDAIIIACHTASAVALEAVRKKFPALLIIGVVDPAVAAAIATTKNNIIGVIGTPATIASRVHITKIHSLLPQAQVVTQACPRLVPLIEQGLQSKNDLLNALGQYLTPLHTAGCDTLIIGCTHYELILHEINDFLERKMFLISAPSKIVQELRPRFNEIEHAQQKIQYYVTGDVEQFRQNAMKLVGLGIESLERLNLSLPIPTFEQIVVPHDV